MKFLFVLVAACALLASHDASSQQGQVMKLRLTVNGAPLAATLDDNAASQDLLKLLPLELTLQDYALAEKIAYLPRKLDAASAPAGFAPSAGDIMYYAPWGNLALFYRDQPFDSGLVRLGRIESGVDALKGANKLKLRLEAVK